MEKKVAENQINFLVDETIVPILKYLPEESKEYINSIDTDSDDVKKRDKETTDSNNKIFSKAIKALVITCIIVFVIVFALYFLSKNNTGFFKSFSLKHLLLECAIILIFIGITEYSFITYFGGRYISIDINKIKITVLEKIKQIFNE